MIPRPANRRFFVTAALLATLVLTGCVTTTDSRFSREADRSEAIDDYVQLATAYIGQGNLDRARHHLDRALELDPDDPGALAALGLINNTLGETELAEKNFKHAIAEDEGFTRARVYYGAFLYAQGRMEASRNQFLAASRDTDYNDRGSVFYNLGLTQERLGELDNAVTSYHRAVELTRGDAKSLLALSRVLMDTGNAAGASRYYSRLLTMVEKNPRMIHSAESLLTGIRIARELGDENLAASLALQLRNNYPESVEYQRYKVLMSNEQ